jgi:hypothetical protein
VREYEGQLIATRESFTVAANRLFNYSLRFWFDWELSDAEDVYVIETSNRGFRLTLAIWKQLQTSLID